MCGPDCIREAITVGHAERLGHGIRALDDRALVDEIRARALPLEVCPSSNVALGFVPSFSAHPLPRLREAGLAVTVNTDIPAVIGTSPTTEYTASGMRSDTTTPSSPNSPGPRSTRRL